MPSMAQKSKGSGDLGTVAEYSQVGLVFPLALVVGFFLGRWLGDWLGGPTVGAAAGVLLGTVAGFYNLFKTLRRIEQREAGRSGERRD
jgi:positive regulator of sigma E activity